MPAHFFTYGITVFFKRGLQRCNLFFWKKIETMPRPIINYWQFLQLQRVIREAYGHVPFYRKFYDSCGVGPENMKNLNDLVQFPIINKRLLRRYPLWEIINDTFLSSQYSWSQTSGSTGEPFFFPVSRNFNYELMFGRGSIRELSVLRYDRFLLWRGLSHMQIREQIRTVVIRSAIIRPRGKYFFPLRLSKFREDPQNFFLDFAKFKPHLIDSRPTVLVELARFADKTLSVKIPQVRFAISVGEVLTPAAREIIENAFGVEVYNLYGLEEMGGIGVECERHDGIHLFEESCMVEILDENDKPVPCGNFGRVIITYFNNDVMPFIRYDTGDYGRIITGACDCGLNTLRMEVDGRYGGFIEIGDKKYHSIELEIVLRRFFSNKHRYRSFGTKVLRYQFVKKENGTVELHVITKEKIGMENVANLKKYFRKKLGMVVDIKVVDDISYQGYDKTQTFIDESSRDLFYSEK